MKAFDFETFNIEPLSHVTLTELAGILMERVSYRSPAQQEIDKKYRGVHDDFLKSLDEAQRELYARYEEQVMEDYNLERERQFICGFKTAMRLAMESMK